MIDSLERIDPIFSLWMCGQDLDSDLEKVRNRYAEEITEGIARDDLGQPEPVYGYRFAAWTRS
ncbi:MAG TPA: hypothetical protein VEH77_14260, partial [Roseiarcus sp.]|nr:hypothetical protein [Roseiarcus sp.]